MSQSDCTIKTDPGTERALSGGLDEYYSGPLDEEDEERRRQYTEPDESGRIVSCQSCGARLDGAYEYNPRLCEDCQMGVLESGIDADACDVGIEPKHQAGKEGFRLAVAEIRSLNETAITKRIATINRYATGNEIHDAGYRIAYKRYARRRGIQVGGEA